MKRCGFRALWYPLIVLGSAIAVRAETVQVEITWQLAGSPGASDVLNPEGTAVLEPVGGGDVITVPLRDGSEQVSVPMGIYHLRLDAAGFWAADQVVEAGRKVTMEIHPVGQWAGRFVVPESAGDATLHARFRTPKQAGESARIDSEVACATEAGRFVCDLPALTLDIELRVDGLVPVYLWDQTVPAGAVRDAGRHRFEPGASVAGWVIDEGAKDGARRDLEIELVPDLGETLSIRHRGATTERLALTRRRQRPNDRGFFQFRGIPPGAYAAIARAPDGATSERLALEVVAEREVRLADPLVLAPPARLEVVVDPPLAPNDDPWHLTLLAPAGAEVAHEGHADWGGAWAATDLEPGTYRLMIEVAGRTDAHTQRWWHDEVEVASPSTFLPVTLSWVDVEGEVRDDDGPVAGALFFGGRFGSPRVVIESDDEGRFAGALPHEGSWQIDFATRAEDSRTIRLEDAEVTEGPSGKALLDLFLSNRQIAGRVVTEDGEGVSGAFVRVLNPERRSKEAETTSGADGVFELRHLRAGEVWVEAEGDSGRAEPLLVDLDEEANDLELVLTEDAEIAGRITVAGRVQTGALVRAIGLSGTGAPITVAKALSDHEGAFRVRIPGAAQQALVVVRHALGATEWRTVDVRQAVENGVEVDLSAQGGRLIVVCEGFPAAALLGPGGELGIHLVADRRAAEGAGLRFEIDRLATGSYQVCPVTDSPRYDQCESLLVTPGGDHEVRLEADASLSTTAVTSDR